MPDLHFLTTTTGQVTMVPRSDVGAPAVALLRPIIVAGGGDIPRLPATHLAIWPLESGGATVFQLAPKPPGDPGGTNPYTMAVACWREDVSAEAWGQAYCIARLVPGAPAIMPDEPPVPWLSATLFPGALALSMDRLAALADLERCIAWTMIEMDATD